MATLLRGIVSFFVIFASLSAAALPGDPDPSFGGGTGVQLIDFGGSTRIDLMAAAAQPATGKIIVAGNYQDASGYRRIALGRLNADGTLDTTFGISGWAFMGQSYTDYSVIGVAVTQYQITVVGKQGPYTFLAITDPSASPNGSLNVVSLDTQSINESVRAVAADAAGNVVAAGSCGVGYPAQQRYACVIAYSGLNRLGSSLVHVQADSSEATALLRSPVGTDLYIAGHFSFGGGTRDAFVTRYDANLVEVPEFGVRVIDFGGDDEVHALLTRNNGHLVLAGQSSTLSGTYLALASVSLFDGTLDSTAWGSGGISLNPVSWNGGAATISVASAPAALDFPVEFPDSIFVAGTLRPYPAQDASRIVVGRFDRAGNLMTGFGSSGWAEVPQQVTGDAVRAIAAFAANAQDAVLTVGALMANGAVLSARNKSYDGTFQASSTTQPYLSTQDSIAGLAALPGGGYAGLSPGNFGAYRMFRTTADGMLDASFGSGGVVMLEYGSYQIAAQPDGRILTTHEVQLSPGNPSSRIGVALERWNPGGSRDATFSGGRVILDLGGPGTNAYAIEVQPDGKIVVALTASRSNPTRIRMAVARVNADGSPDVSFGGGAVFIDNVAGDEEARGLALMPDGRIVVGGILDYAAGNAVHRLLPDGAIDPSWAGGASAIGPCTPYGYTGRVLAATPSGHVYVGGSTGQHSCISRFDPAGQADTSWGGTGFISYTLAQYGSDAIVGLALDDYARVVAASSGEGPSLIRILPNGEPDNTYGYNGFAYVPNVTPQRSLSGLVRHGDDRVAAFGAANQFGDGGDVLIARFLGGGAPVDGTPDAFTFVDVSGVAPGAVATSNAITVAGISAAVPVTVGGGLYSIGCTGSFTEFEGTVVAGDTVCVRHIAASQPATSTHTTLTIGGVADTFTSTTADLVDTTITGAPPNPSAGAGATFTFASSNPGITIRFECAINGGAWSACTSPAVYSVPQGTHTFAVRAVSNAGPDPTPATYTWQVDLSQPETTITSGPADPTPVASTSVTFTFTSNEAGTFQCSFDTAPYAACTSPKTYDNLIQGGHVFNVRAVDTVGNIDPTPARRIFTVDVTPPDTFFISGVNTYSSSPTATLSFGGSEPDLSFECRIDAGPYVACSSPVTYSGLADGNHTFRVRAVDLAGNADPTPASVSWLVDTVPPETTLTTWPPAVANTNAATFSFTSNEQGAGFECSLDSAPFAFCSRPVGLTNLAQGSHTFAVRAMDLAENVDPTPATYTWLIDSVPPHVTITSGPGAIWNSATATFEFVSDDPGATLQCSLDGAGFAPCSSPKTYTSLAEGVVHSFSVRAVDAAGNIDPGFPVAWFSVDLTPPDTTITSSPSILTSARNASFTFIADQPNGTFECALDGGAFAACTTPATYADLPDGLHTFRVRAIDPAGNVDATPSQHQWTVDTQAPETVVSSGPATVSPFTSATFTMQANDPAATFQCYVDSPDYAPCASPVTFTNLPEGAHRFVARAIDAAGNVGAPSVFAWVIDTTNPDTTIDSSPPALTNDATGTFTFSGSEQAVTFECRLDNGEFLACVSPFAYAAVADGQHTFAVRARDAAGNVDAQPATFTWTVDTTPPNTLLAFSPAAPVTNSTSFTATLGFSIEPITFECRVDGGAWAACASPVTQSGLADGTHTFEVRAKDAAGNYDPTPATHTWTTDTAAPDTTITGGPSGTVTANSATFSYTTSETNPPFAFECRLDGAPFASCSFASTSYSGLADGTHTFEVRSRDGAGNWDPTPASRTWTIDATPPDTSIVSGPSGPTASVNATFTFASTEPGSTFQCRIDGSSYVACLPDGITYLGGAQGAHTFEVRAIDAAGNADATPASRTWTIDTVAPDTTITGGPSGNNNPDTATFTFTSTEAGTFQCKLDAGAFTACSSGVTYTALPKAEHTFQVRAVDAAGNVDATPATRTWRSNK